MTRKILALITLIFVLSTCILPVFAASYTIPVSNEAVTVNPGENNQLLFTYNGSSLKWQTFKSNPSLTLYISNGVGQASYRLLVNGTYSSNFSTSILSGLQIGSFAVAINWDFLESKFSDIIPDDLTQSFVVVAGSGNIRNIHFYTTIESSDDSGIEDDREHGGGGTSFDEDPKSWFDYILDGIENCFAWLVEQIKNIFHVEGIMEAIKLLFDSIGDLFATYLNFDMQPFHDFLDSINSGAISYILRIWEFPIIKQFMYGVILLALVAGLLTLFKTI